MSTTKSLPYDWIGELDPKIAELDDIPLFGHPPSFPWDAFSKKLSQIFEVDDIVIASEDPKWRSEEELFSDLGSQLYPITFSVPEFDGEVSWIVPKEDISFFMSALLARQESPVFQDISEDFQEGFYQFLAIETIHVISELDFDETLSPHLSQKKELPKGPALCLDVSIKLMNRTLWGRLAISHTFRKSWKEHYSHRKTSDSEESMENVPVDVHVEIGKTFLPFNEWKQVKKGDFILLDRCDYDPEDQKGNVILSIKDRPILTARLKKGKLKIQGKAHHQEVNTPMEKENYEEYEEENTEIEDEDTTYDDLEIDEDEEYEIVEEEVEEGEDDDEYEIIEEEVEVDDDEEDEDEEEESELLVEKFDEPPVAPEEIPLNLIVEIGRVQMPMQQLMDMQPGNVLELGVKPEDGVNIVVNGRCVAKGELLKVGKALGVRIIDKGKSTQ